MSSEPMLEIGAWNLPLRKWASLFKRKPRPLMTRFKAGYDPVAVVFGRENPNRRPPSSRVIIRIGEYELPIHAWAKRTGQRSTEIAKRLEAGLEPADAIFFDPPKGYRPRQR